LRFPESPENNDFILLVNDALDDTGAEVVDAVDAGAGGGALSPVRLPNEEHAVSVATTATAPTACHQPRRPPSREAFAWLVCRLRRSTLIMRILCPEGRPYSSGSWRTKAAQLGPSEQGAGVG
jgi:hypothetical protein